MLQAHEAVPGRGRDCTPRTPGTRALDCIPLDAWRVSEGKGDILSDVSPNPGNLALAQIVLAVPYRGGALAVEQPHGEHEALSRHRFERRIQNGVRFHFRRKAQRPG